MAQQKANDLMGGQITAATIHAADAVGIAIGHEANVVRMTAQIFLGRPIILEDGFRIDAAEENIVLCIERGDAAVGSCKNLFEASRADAEERVMGKAQFRFGDEFEIHELL